MLTNGTDLYIILKPDDTNQALFATSKPSIFNRHRLIRIEML